MIIWGGAKSSMGIHLCVFFYFFDKEENVLKSTTSTRTQDVYNEHQKAKQKILPPHQEPNQSIQSTKGIASPSIYT